MVELRELDFDLPERLIASHPPAERVDARLMVATPGDDRFSFTDFRQLPDFLRGGDLLVMNDTRVLPARLVCRKRTGGQVEGLFLEEQEDGRARCMLSGGRLREGVELQLSDDAPLLRLDKKLPRGEWLLDMQPAMEWGTFLFRHGSTPLPPYIRKLRSNAGEAEDSEEDRQRYQTLWAQRDGSVAAPTASLHFDAFLLRRLAQAGVEFAHLTLHVGQGTFLPVECERVEEHAMHAERFEVGADLVAAMQHCRESGGRVIAIGTTVCRALEAHARGDRGSTDLMILPGHRFQAVDGLLTNFHTPRSTLLALVAAVAQHLGAADGLSFVKRSYAAAIAEQMRFYSYGDTSLWVPE